MIGIIGGTSLFGIDSGTCFLKDAEWKAAKTPHGEAYVLLNDNDKANDKE